MVSEKNVMLWTVWGVLTTLTISITGRTDIVHLTRHQASPPAAHENMENASSSTQTAALLKGVVTTDKTPQHWGHRDTALTTPAGQPELPTPAVENSRDLFHNVTFNLSTCVQQGQLHPILIGGTEGHLLFQNMDDTESLPPCVVTLQAPSDKALCFRIKKCWFAKFWLEDFVNNTRQEIFHRESCPFLLPTGTVCSVTHSVRIKVQTRKLWRPESAGSPNLKLSLYFSAMNQSDRASLERRQLSPTSGYLQTPGWNGSLHYPPHMRSCMVLTPPDHHVLFLGFLSLELHNRDTLTLFPGRCHFKDLYCRSRLSLTNRDNRQCFKGRNDHVAFLFPDDFVAEQEEADTSLSFYFSSDFVAEQEEADTSLSFYFSSHQLSSSSGFRLRYSFHRTDLKPVRIHHQSEEGGKRMPMRETTWNCSQAVWPGLYEHFPCDLLPQCEEFEDESRCPYRSEKCGDKKVEAGGRCYIYHQQRSMWASWFDASRRCQQYGAKLVSLETRPKWTDVTKLLEHSLTDVSMWIGLKANLINIRQPFLETMYKNTWRWESGSVNYFLPLSLPQNEEQTCGYWRTTTSSAFPVVKSSSCLTTSHNTAYLCEFTPQHVRIHRPFPLPAPKHVNSSHVHLVTCPEQHVTQETFACDLESACWKVDRSLKEMMGTSCEYAEGHRQPYFHCRAQGEFPPDHRFVPYSVVCDFRFDCESGADEDFCVYPPCGGSQFSCGEGQCVDYDKLCDGFLDCLTYQDEAECAHSLNTHEDWDFAMSAVPNPITITSNTSATLSIVNFDRPGGFTLTTVLAEDNTGCPDSHFVCPGEKLCLPLYVRCNGVNDCLGHEDEGGCTNYRCPGFYRCRGQDRTTCLHPDHVCDGRPQCPQRDDELMCDLTCPGPCLCQGLALTCTHTFDLTSFPQLRYLEAKGSGVQQGDVLHNVMLIHLGVQACGWRNLSDFPLPNLHSLDLSHNLLRHVNFSRFVRMHHLKRLSLAGNPLQDSLFHLQGTDQLQSPLDLNLSGVPMRFFNLSFLSETVPRLVVLDLSDSAIKFLQGQATFPFLHSLRLKNCPVSDFTPHFMQTLRQLQFVSASNYKLCCSAVLPQNFRGECLAPADELSSCDDLLKSGFYRTALVMFAVLAILGNLGSFVYRLCSSSESVKIGFAVFVLHLCVSDLLMGVYLAVVGVADRVYAGSYVWREGAWKTSTACVIAGFLSFVSSEVSAFLICLITLDRFLVLRFPFSQVRFRATSAHAACCVIWTLGLALATVPLLPVTSQWAFYQQTGICIPLPVTRTDFEGHGYSFSVMIVCNLVLFLLIAVGQLLIYWSVQSNTFSRQTTTEAKNKVSDVTKSKEAVIARRLLSIAMSDFMCWFPIGLCGVLAAVGVTVPGEVNVFMAIFVLPLNSALNPFLYTLNVTLEKRRRVQELRLQRFLVSHLSKHSVGLQSMAGD